MLRLGPVVLTGETQSIVPFWTDIAQVVADQAFWSYGKREILLPGWGAMYWLNVGLVIMSLLHLVVSHWDRPTRCAVFAAWAILPPLSLLTFAGQRSHYYMLPWFPLPVLLVAGLLSRWAQLKGRRWWVGLTLALLVVTNLAMHRRYARWLARPDYDYFLAAPLDVKQRAVDAVLRNAGARGYDLLLVSWDWSNNKPYNYLVSNAAAHPHEVRMLVVNPETKATSHHNGLKDRVPRARIQVRVDRLGHGNPGQHRNLSNGISELKIDYGPGYRVYYTRRGTEVIILLAGGDKSSQQRDMNRAVDLAQYL